MARLLVLALTAAVAFSWNAPLSAQEPHSSHHSVLIDDTELVSASVEVRMPAFSEDRDVLYFFALDCGFGGGAAAHGGLMFSGKQRRANWGGLAGAGYDVKTEPERRAFMEVLQNTPGRTASVGWEHERWYRYEIRRAGQEVLPPGSYAALDEPPIFFEQSRTMWRWDFRVTDIATGNVVWSHELFTAAAYMTHFGYWTETGYGVTCTDSLEVHWREPWYTTSASNVPRRPRSILRSVYQSTCDDATTTHTLAEDFCRWGTVQHYAVPRPSWAGNHTALYDRGQAVCAQGQTEACGSCPGIDAGLPDDAGASDAGPDSGSIVLLDAAADATADATNDADVPADAPSARPTRAADSGCSVGHAPSQFIWLPLLSMFRRRRRKVPNIAVEDPPEVSVC